MINFFIFVSKQKIGVLQKGKKNQIRVADTITEVMDLNQLR